MSLFLLGNKELFFELFKLILRTRSTLSLKNTPILSNRKTGFHLEATKTITELLKTNRLHRLQH